MVKFRDYYAEFTGVAVGQKIFLYPGDVEDIEEFTIKKTNLTTHEGYTVKQCNLYTKSQEHVVAHSADEVFEILQKSVDNFNYKKIKSNAENTGGMQPVPPLKN